MRARLKHIDDRLIWFGFLRLTDHASKFGISDVQGKIDIKTYRNLSDTPPPERKPGPPVAGAAPVGQYVRPSKFTPIFDSPGTLDDLFTTRLEDVGVDMALSIERVLPPTHSVDPDRVRPLLAAIELKESCKLHYQSMTSLAAVERVVCPHALVKASGRWHVRAFDFARKRFIDFSLSRVLGSEPFPAQTAVPANLDDDWFATVSVELVPHPKLSTAQRHIIGREFKMDDGQLVVQTRRALLFYLLDEMRLLAAVRRGEKDAADVPIWIRNFRHVASELSIMDAQRDATAHL
ncbi:WYL domain-containing protein [Bradyrhizobium australafricanum]|uniref:WYL domain-containing protein n=1 Tax=Bradyrhizobium australafricanum TaxID=2821406 RepID=UPI001CE27EC2|nr:WYL domain-containing protein [Bradyrhizobium australafricanum]MCA6101598.1 WYL domain-containing protein [Bradyrhizobium australafricanum]